MQYTNYTNMDSRFSRPYEPGDRLVRGWSGEVDWHPSVNQMLEVLYERHNRDDRPDGQLCPSMSIGDVVVIGEVAYSVATWGFFGPVVLDAADLITDRTWREVEY